ncbi:MAG: hypothetical protein IKC80_03855, partial [Kiritimatiellae bacterium]|nr:hypothetical protein [Kiritimatiellia bacterium]
MRNRFFFATLLAFVWMGVAGAASVWEIPNMTASPQIDGVATPGEWDSAFRVIGAGKSVDSRFAEISLAWDKENLYVCTRSETAPRGRLATSAGSMPGTARIVMDDSVELWFDPPKELRNADETKRFGYFQMIVNHKGDIYGCHHSPGYGLPARDWKLDSTKRKWTITNDVWTLEMAIPAKTFGLKAFEPFTLPLLPVRNFRLQSGIQAPFLQPGGGFMDAANYPKMRLVRSATGRTIDRREKGAAPFVWATPEANIVAEGSEKYGVVGGVVKGVCIPIPGSLVVRTKATEKLPPKKWRRYFSTAFRQSGYLGFQEDTVNGRAMLFFAHHFKGVPAVNKRLRCPADGKENVIAVNFEPRKVTYHLNGVKQGETDLPMDLSAIPLGDLTLGGGADGLVVKSWTLYRRKLTDGEIKAFSQGDTPVSGTLAWYPSINSIVADVTCNGTVLACASLAWSVLPRGEADATPLAKGELPLAGGFGDGALTLVRKRLPLGRELP